MGVRRQRRQIRNALAHSVRERPPEQRSLHEFLHRRERQRIHELAEFHDDRQFCVVEVRLTDLSCGGRVDEPQGADARGGLIGGLVGNTIEELDRGIAQ